MEGGTRLRVVVSGRGRSKWKGELVEGSSKWKGKWLG